MLLRCLTYPRGIFVSLFTVLWTGVMSFVILAVAVLIRHRRVVDLFIDYGWCLPILKLANVGVDLRGRDRVQRLGKGFLILFNHSSNMDIPVLYAYFPRSFRFGAKIELFKIPVFGWAMRVCGVLPIDRRNRNKVMRVYDEAIGRVARGECFALAPEGTRQSQPQLGPFKRGPFEFAINAGMDIVPVVMAGTYAVLPRKSLWINQGQWRRTVIMEILPSVSVTEFPLDRVSDLQDEVRRRMLDVHERLYSELGSRV